MKRRTSLLTGILAVVVSGLVASGSAVAQSVAHMAPHGHRRDDCPWG